MRRIREFGQITVNVSGPIGNVAERDA